MVPAFLLPYPEGLLEFPWNVEIGPNTMREIADRNGNVLWLVGEIDYRDRFQKIHRGGYGRAYAPNGPGLVFNPSTARLNYDRPLSPAEIAQCGYDS